MSFADDRTIGEWSKLKLEFLQSYLKGYLNATNTAIHRYYIDCFGGHLDYIHKETGEKIPGSCKVSLSLDKSFSEYFFIELDNERIDELNILKKEFQNRKINIFQGDCNVEIAKALNKINRKSPTFVFLDTDGINIKWETIKSLSLWRTELLINFPFQMSIKRNLDKSPHKITEFYGTDEWKVIYENKELGTHKERMNKMIMLYINNIKNLGYEHVIISDSFKNSNGVPMYYLVFASNNKVGEKIMNHVFSKQFSEQLSIFDNNQF